VYPLKEAFGISRGVKSTAHTVIVRIEQNGFAGRGECVPYSRYGENVDQTLVLIQDNSTAIERGASRQELMRLMPPGAARNAIDCALWDLEAKTTQIPVFDQKRHERAKITTAYTIPYGPADHMERIAARNAFRPLLKLKLGSSNDLNRLYRVAAAAEGARLIVDANEGWSLPEFESLIDDLVACNVSMVEQPLPARSDETLVAGVYPFHVCADESCHDRNSLSSVIGRYDMINIKLDKTGGLTEAVELKAEAREAGLEIMVGCMVSGSLAIAPACYIAQDADLVDLDGPLFLARDIGDGIEFHESHMSLPKRALWG